MKRRAVAVAFDFAARAAAALVLAAPAAAVVEASGIGAFPAGDRLLFERGGLLLVEVVRTAWTLLPPLATSSLLCGLLLAVALSLPRAYLWTVMAADAPEPHVALLGRAWAQVPSLLTLTGFGFLAQVLALTLTFAAATWMRGAITANAMHADLWALAVAALGGALVLGLGVVRDLASAALACGSTSGRAALLEAAACLRRAPGAPLLRWLGPAVLGLSLVSAAALATGALDVSRPGAGRFVAVTLVHQAVALALSVCRGAWYGAAVRLVRPQLAAGSAARR